MKIGKFTSIFFILLLWSSLTAYKLSLCPDIKMSIPVNEASYLIYNPAIGAGLIGEMKFGNLSIEADISVNYWYGKKIAPKIGRFKIDGNGDGTVEAYNMFSKYKNLRSMIFQFPLIFNVKYEIASKENNTLSFFAGGGPVFYVYDGFFYSSEGGDDIASLFELPEGATYLYKTDAAYRPFSTFGLSFNAGIEIMYKKFVFRPAFSYFRLFRDELEYPHFMEQVLSIDLALGWRFEFD